MKGIVFTEFIEMVEELFSPDIADEIIMESDLPSDGIYTSVATYDHHEMLTLVTKLSEKTGLPVAELVRSYGKHLLGRFVVLYPDFFAKVDGTFSFLDTIENHVHVEVRKLYTDVELPTFETSRDENGNMVMHYSSSRPFADLAEGLIKGVIDHFGEEIQLTREDVEGSNGSEAFFTLTMRQV
ncbi:heme NO-binding domain-containing protein [Vibrio sp. JC009]|uniref:heme NO-binding domain-containing protein n=1 Tax=Vibrio sp. JC009 TaxID=2912314 RepID=UPI0023B1FE40|nr:heme NO-binding domain-containing protein [Vibrio sp. JC009]WED23735.1 heme NO-binding domain-containing protein [Vibrio sp. JC009]